MTSLSGFWAGTYHYPQTHIPNVNFDCELHQSGVSVSGEITESHAPGQMLLARISGDLNGDRISFVKSYKATHSAFLLEIAYSGQVSPKKDHITGVWRVGGRQGTFEMHRDVGQLREVELSQAADDQLLKTPI